MYRTDGCSYQIPIRPEGTAAEDVRLRCVWLDDLLTAISAVLPGSTRPISTSTRIQNTLSYALPSSDRAGCGQVHAVHVRGSDADNYASSAAANG
jgi:hypothetical protein